MEELSETTKSKEVPLETKAKIIHTLVFPTTMYGRKSWTVKTGNKIIHLKYGLGEELNGYPEAPGR